MMCLVHDLAEAQGELLSLSARLSILTPFTVGDITPHEGITRDEKLRLEEARAA